MSSINVLSIHENVDEGLSNWRIASRNRPNTVQIYARLAEEAALGKAPAWKEPIIHIVRVEKSDLREEEKPGKLPNGYRIYEIAIIDTNGAYWKQRLWTGEVSAYREIHDDAEWEYERKKVEADLPEAIVPIGAMPEIRRFQKGVLSGVFCFTVDNRLQRLLPIIRPYITTIEDRNGLFVVDSENVNFDEDSLGGKFIMITNEDGFAGILFHHPIHGSAHFHIYDEELKNALAEKLKKS